VTRSHRSALCACAWGWLTQRADVASYTTKASRAGRGSLPLAATTSRTLPLAGTSHATAFSSQLPAPPAGSADPHRTVSPSPNPSRPATPRRPLLIPPFPLLPLADAFALVGRFRETPRLEEIRSERMMGGRALLLLLVSALLVQIRASDPVISASP
jgi:hypothetical protein